MNSIFIKIVSPFKNEFKGEVSYIELPTITGIIGIYPNHIPTISALSDGIIKLKTEAEILEFQINGGFLRFSENKCHLTIKSIKKLEKIA